jgi:hypothetical protein
MLNIKRRPDKPACIVGKARRTALQSFEKASGPV